MPRPTSVRNYFASGLASGFLSAAGFFAASAFFLASAMSFSSALLASVSSAVMSSFSFFSIALISASAFLWIASIFAFCSSVRLLRSDQGLTSLTGLASAAGFSAGFSALVSARTTPEKARETPAPSPRAASASSCKNPERNEASAPIARMP
jgi:hypothetical protein